MKKTLSTFLMSAVLMAPVVVRAMDDHDRDAQGRYYDPTYRDYHEWNEHEDHAYREYLKQRHHEYKEWTKADAKQQEAYWKWRHKHPDAAIAHDEH